MTNLDRMKASLISQIENMNAEEFEKIADALVETGMQDESFRFSCKKCESRYGEECTVAVCSKRFKEYAEETAV